MKTTLSLIFRIAVLTLLISCSDDNTPSTPPNTIPIVTDVGTPMGAASSMSIGASGGTLQSADGRMTIIIPEGALASTTAISIQPITNEGPLGLGAGYRLLPEDINFTKPATLQFHYDEDLLAGIPEDFLWIITQTSTGSWNAMLKSVVNITTKSVSIETIHFSDWTLGKFIDLSLSPSSSTILKGQSVQLNVAGFVRDQSSTDDDELAPLIPITGDLDGLTPLTPIPPIESRFMNFSIKGWMLNGVAAPISNSNGALTASNNNATYTAPNKRPVINPVAVSVELESSNKEGRKAAYILNASISVVESNLYLLVKVDGQSYEYYQYGLNGSAPPDPNNFAIANCGFSENTLSIVGSTFGNGIDLSDLFGLELKNPAEGTRSLTCFQTEDVEEDDINFMPSAGTAYENERIIRTKTPDDCIREYVCSDISITLLDFENEFQGKVRGYFSGTLYEDRPGYSDDCLNPVAHTIEGEFWLELIK